MIVKEETMLTVVILKTADVCVAVATCSVTFKSDILMGLFYFSVPSVRAMILSHVATGLSFNSRKTFKSYFYFFTFNSVCSLVCMSI